MFIFYLCLCLIFIKLLVSQVLQPCPENPIELIGNDFVQYVYSPYDERKNYPPNTDCRFLIRARNLQKKIHISIIESTLEEPLFTDCDDYVSVRDGSLPTSKEIIRWCGSEYPYSLTSSGPSFYIHFHSDGIIQKRGFNISYMDFDFPGCPPEWETNNESEYCYKIFLPPYGISWTEAQKQCYYEKSNLLTISNLNEYTELANMFSKLHSFPWIGYSDAATEGNFISIDPQIPLWPETFPKFNNDHFTKDCLFMDWNIKDNISFAIDDCRSRHSFVCKKNTDGSTQPITPPTNLIRNGIYKHRLHRTIWLLIIAAIVLLSIILFTVYWKYKKSYSNKIDNINQKLVNNIEGSHARDVTTSKKDIEKRNINSIKQNSSSFGKKVLSDDIVDKQKFKKDYASSEKMQHKNENSNHNLVQYHFSLQNMNSIFENNLQLDSLQNEENALTSKQSKELIENHRNIKNEINVENSNNLNNENEYNKLNTNSVKGITMTNAENVYKELSIVNKKNLNNQHLATNTNVEVISTPTFRHPLIDNDKKLFANVTEKSDITKMHEEVQTDENDQTIISNISDDFDGIEMPPMNPHTQKKQKHMHILNNINAKTEEEIWS